MPFAPGDILHIYNRGNNKLPIFFKDEHYQFFQKKVKDHIVPVCDILAYCLMPNHFHFLVQVNKESCNPKKLGSLSSTELTNSFRVLQSSYALGVNKDMGLTGSLFQQKAKFKILSPSTNMRNDYLQCCFHYIHQNPLRAGLVQRIEDWKYSSFNEYADSIPGLCNRSIANQLLDIRVEKFYGWSYSLIDEHLLVKIKGL